jgi:hypothetical protein
MSLHSDEIIKISQRYLGPSAKAFLERTAKKNMNGVDFTTMDRTQIAELAKNVESSAAPLIGKEKAAELAGLIAKVQ